MRFSDCHFDEVTVQRLWALVNPADGGEGFWSDLSRNNRRLLKVLLEGSMVHWRERYVQVPWHQPDPDGRVDRCNGYYTRKSWPTVVGPLEQVRVPRCRNKGLTERMKAKVGDGLNQVAGQVTEMLIAGVSTRRVGELLTKITGLSLSAGSASQLARRLDAEARSFHCRPLKDHYAYLFLDGVYLKARGEKPSPTRRRKFKPRKRIVLTAYGVTEAGIKELIDFQLAESESAEACGKFLWNLYHRGLAGAKVRLIVSDRGGGLTAAAEEVYPMVARQACWFHKIRNVLNKIRRLDQEACVEGLRGIYGASSRREAMANYRAWAGRWRGGYPKAVACLNKDLDRLLAFYATPSAHWKMVRTTNAIERCFREVRRRTDSIGTFLDDGSINRLVYGLFAYMNHKRAGKACKEFKDVKVAA